MLYIPVLAKADLMAKGLVAQLAGVGLLAVVGAARVHLESVRRGEHFLALHARVQVAKLMQARPLGGHVMEVQMRLMRQTQMPAARWHAYANAHTNGCRCRCRRGSRSGAILASRLEWHHQAAQSEEIFLRVRMVAAQEQARETERNREN